MIIVSICLFKIINFSHLYTCKITFFSQKKNSTFDTKFRVFSKIPPISKIPRSKKYVLLKKSTFDTKFRVFQKIPSISKIPRFSKSTYFSKSRLFQQNMIHRHKHLFFPNAFLVHLSFFTPLNFKILSNTCF